LGSGRIAYQEILPKYKKKVNESRYWREGVVSQLLIRMGAVSYLKRLPRVAAFLLII